MYVYQYLPFSNSSICNRLKSECFGLSMLRIPHGYSRSLLVSHTNANIYGDDDDGDDNNDDDDDNNDDDNDEKI
jgi:hypothetical protein